MSSVCADLTVYIGRVVLTRYTMQHQILLEMHKKRQRNKKVASLLDLLSLICITKKFLDRTTVEQWANSCLICTHHNMRRIIPQHAYSLLLHNNDCHRFIVCVLSKTYSFSTIYIHG